MPHVQLVTAGIQKAKDCIIAGMKATEIIEILLADYAVITTPVIRVIVSSAVKNSRLPKWSAK